MIERRSVERYVADIEVAQNLLTDVPNATVDHTHAVAIHAKRLELKLASAKLAQAEYSLEALIARRQLLEARCSEGCATKTEQDELAWAAEALPVNAVAVERLAADHEALRRELASLLA